MLTILAEAKRLHALGFSVIWLHPKSKRPVDTGWTKAPRKTWEELKRSYRDGYNIGVRTGKTSRLENGYLACIDVDVKDPIYREKAIEVAQDLMGFSVFPEVRSGSGNGSRHYYGATKEPFKMITVAKEKDKFEVCIYSNGRQMVLPPSIHPDTGNRYEWFTPIGPKIPLLDVSASPQETDDFGKVDKNERNVTEDFQVEPVDLGRLDISQRIRQGILKGEGVADRSAFLLPACNALVSAGLNRNEVLSVLTDSRHYLGACAYDHAKTSSRKVAARWIWRYTLQKVMEERSASKAFAAAAEITDNTLSKDDAEKQAKDLDDWRSKIARAKHGAPYTTIENVVLILKNAIAPDLVKLDLFSYREHFTCDTPWGTKTGTSIGDVDFPCIRLWLGENWGFEPAKETIVDALTVIGFQNAYDPVVDFFDNLPAWDRVKRIDTWLAQNFEAKGHPDYLAQVFRKWLVAIVMRVYHPGAKFDWLPIFEGAQGVGKSSFGRLLVGDKYFLDQLPPLADKEAALALQGIQAVEIGELASFRKNELEVVKAFLTRTVDKVRPPFGRKTIESARRCVFYGTTNKDTYLRDETGNRRFKPVKVGQLDFDALNRDRLQLFAEAKHLYESFQETEITLELTNSARRYEKEIHQEKMVGDDSLAMRELFINYVQKNPDFDFKKVSIPVLFEVLGPFQKYQFTNANMQIAAKTMKNLGGERYIINGRKYWKFTNLGVFDADF